MLSAWRQQLQASLVRAWTRRGLIATVLWPVSLLLQILVWSRRELYQAGVLKTQSVDALVIVVGNVVAGGAGKTPTVIALVQYLSHQGYSVGVVSRGYGRADTTCTEVVNDSSPQSVGDEPLLVHRATRVPVFVARRRHEAATALLEKHPGTQIIVCDDGLQHYALYRDMEICVFDNRGCGNRWCLPAGPLREPWPRRAVARAGQSNGRLLTLHTGGQPAFAGFTATRKLASVAIGRDNVPIALSTLAAPGAQPLLAIAGIAQPEAFFSMLRALNLPLHETLALPDHYHFDSFPRKSYEGYRIICTEKDAPKLWAIAPSALAIPLIFEPEPAFFTAVDATVADALAAKLSSGNGHKTT